MEMLTHWKVEKGSAQYIYSACLHEIRTGMSFVDEKKGNNVILGIINIINVGSRMMFEPS
jgi:rRNA maturation protein Rpf1